VLPRCKLNPLAFSHFRTAVDTLDRTLAQLAEQFDVHPNQITAWKAQLEDGAADVFGSAGGKAAEPVVDVKALHAKIGELPLETDFLDRALNKAELLSAKR
jgi:transposase-like protein